MGSSSQDSFLRDEYLLLQQQYEDYDKRSLTIKGWVSSGAIAAFALSFSTDSSEVWLIPIFTAVLTLSVWYLETSWKIFQYGLSSRIRIIEAHFREEPDILFKDPKPFQIYHWWFKTTFEDPPIYDHEITRSRYRRFIFSAFQPFVMLPYVPILILCALSYFLIG